MLNSEQVFLKKNLEKIQQKLNDKSDVNELLNDTSFIALLDTLIPNRKLLEKHLLLKSEINSNLDTSKIFNKMYTQIEEIKNNHQKIVLYGNGIVTQMVKHLFDKKIIAIADKAVHSDTCLPEDLHKYDYDCLLIMVLGRETEIENYLKNKCLIDDSKIFKFNLNL